MNGSIRALLAACGVVLCCGSNALAAPLSDYVIFSKDRVTLGGGSDAIGRVGSGGETGMAGGTSITGSLDVGTNVHLNHGADVTGTVTHGGTFKKSPTSIVGAVVHAAPSLPTLPPITAFSAGGTDFGGFGNGATLTLPPGSYGSVKLGGNSNLNLTKGDYQFTSFNAGNGFRLRLDLKGGNIRLFFKGKVHIGSSKMEFLSGGNANNVYIEAHGSSDEFAFATSGGDWRATIYAPYAGIHYGSGSCCAKFIGHMYSATYVDIEHGVTLSLPPTEECPPGQVRNEAGQCVIPDCPPGQVRGPDGLCQTPECPPGQVRNEAGQCVTDDCPAGQVRNEQGVCVNTDCPPGQIRNQDGQCITEECPPGQIRNDAGQCVIPECPEGQVRNSEGQCVIQECPAGTVRQSDGRCITETCPDGKPKNPDGSCGSGTCPAGQIKGPDGICSIPECETPGQVKDKCGNCGGDGSACVSCENKTIIDEQLALDSTGLEQRNLVFRIADQIKRLGGSKNRAKSKALKKQADALYMDQWHLAYQLPSVIISNCGPTAACVQVSTTDATTAFVNRSVSLRDLALKNVKALKKNKRITSKNYNNRTKDANKWHNANLKTVASIPTTTSLCAPAPTARRR